VNDNRESVQPIVKLLDPGAAPRTALRYSFVKGRQIKLAFVQKNNIGMMVGDERMPETDVPAIKTMMQWTVDDVNADSAQIGFTILSAKVDGGDVNEPMVQQVNAMLADFKSIRGWQRTDRLGKLLDFKIDLGGLKTPQIAQMLESIKQSLGQVVSQFPEEPIGVGGSWQTISQVDQFGMHLTQSATYRVTQVDSRGIQTDVELSQTAPAGKVSPPGMPEGTTVDLLGLESKGQGKVRIDYQNFVSALNISFAISLKMLVPEGPGVPVGGQKLAMDMNTIMKIVPTK
jgi:hypothetical protein